MSDNKDYCVKCGRTVQGELSRALLIGLGCFVSGPEPGTCLEDGGLHEYGTLAEYHKKRIADALAKTEGR